MCRTSPRRPETHVNRLCGSTEGQDDATVIERRWWAHIRGGQAKRIELGVSPDRWRTTVRERDSATLER